LKFLRGRLRTQRLHSAVSAGVFRQQWHQSTFDPSIPGSSLLRLSCIKEGVSSQGSCDINYYCKLICGWGEAIFYLHKLDCGDAGRTLALSAFAQATVAGVGFRFISGHNLKT